MPYMKNKYYEQIESFGNFFIDKSQTFHIYIRQLMNTTGSENNFETK